VNHNDMRTVLRAAFAAVIGREGTIHELQCLRAISSLESGDGEYWKPPGNGSFNLGALQAGSSWSGATFEYRDTTPQPDGSSKSYVTKFRKYPTLIAGAEDLVRVVFVNMGRSSVLKAASEGNTLRFSAGLYCVSSPAARDKETAEVLEQFGIAPTGYYQGWGKTPAERIAHHHKAVVASIRAQALALSESLPADIAALPSLPALLRVGAKGTDVEKLQRELNRQIVTPLLKVDGDFGEATRRNVVAFQRRAKLVADGIVGERTWSALAAPST
jgi:hypothetical protein